MARVDLISDMLTRLRNAILVKSNKVDVLRTKLNLGITKILKEEGFIESYEELGELYPIQSDSYVRKYITITLKYKGPKQIPYITELKRISKPGLRVYVSYKKIPNILGGIGLAVLSTSRGLMTDKDAKLNKVGGEFLFHIW